MPNDVALPVAAGQFGNLAPQLGGPGLPPSMQILFNDGLYDRVKQLAGIMARAEGFTPKHLLGKSEACFTVIMIALDAKLIPHFVARHTYQTPGGQIGFDGALVQSILEQSGKFVGSPQFEYTGDWSKIRGRFEKKTSQKGNEFIVPTWGPKEADGLGIIVRWRVSGEDTPRIWPGEGDPFLLTQCFPLNSPLWATDPKTQIAYLAIRRFANIAAPGILGGAIPDPGEMIDASDRAVDVTPQPEPRRENFVVPEHLREATRFYDVPDLDGEVHAFTDPLKAASAIRVVLSDASRRGVEVLDEAWERSLRTVEQFDQRLKDELASEYTDLRERVIETGRRSAASVVERHQKAARQAFQPQEGAEQSENLGRTPDDGSAVSEPRGVEPDPSLADAPKSVIPDEAGGSPASAAQTSQRPSPPAEAAESRPEGQGVLSPSPSPTRDGIAQPSQETPVVASDGPAKLPERGQGVAVASSPARVEQSEPDYDSERPSQCIPVPIDQRTGKPNLRTWAMALFLPKVRRKTDGTDLAWLMGDNQASVEACKEGALSGDDLTEFTAAINDAWKRCK